MPAFHIPWEKNHSRHQQSASFHIERFKTRHRADLKKGPAHFHEYFFLAEEKQKPKTRLQSRRAQHGRQLKEYRAGTHLNVLRRSVLGLVTIYNLLPAWVVQLEQVKDFQQALQEHVKERACPNCEDWRLTYSPRLPLYRHPLR